MKRTPIYSRPARKHRVNAVPDAVAQSAPADTPPPTTPEERPKRFGRSRAFTGAFIAKHQSVLLVASSVLLSALLFLAYTLATSSGGRFTQEDIDAAVLHTLEKTTLPSAEAKAFERVRQSVVRVVRVEDGVEQSPAGGGLSSVGTGVVIIDKGAILTNLHVVDGDEKTKLKVQFANGLESDAIVLRRLPENDLALIEATTVPDGLKPAVLRSTHGLGIGEKVVAVGFPFNIGPSASAGVISGLKRTYRSPDDNEILHNLIQFDAAANPGNSGGPLVTMDGEVVGIVTAILSPHEQGTFIGIGFAVPIETAAAAAGDPPF